MIDQLFGLPVPITPGVVFVDVWNMRATVAQFYALPDGSIGRRYAINGEDLAEDAAQAVNDQGGALNVSGLYHCPPELAARAQWDDSPQEETQP